MDESITHEQATSEAALVSLEADQARPGGDSNGGPARPSSPCREALKRTSTPSWASTSSISVSSTTWRSRERRDPYRVHADHDGLPDRTADRAADAVVPGGRARRASVEAEVVLRPPWTPEMMSEEAKAALKYF